MTGFGFMIMFKTLTITASRQVNNTRNQHVPIQKKEKKRKRNQHVSSSFFYIFGFIMFKNLTITVSKKIQ